MYESLFPADDIWEKFGIPPEPLCSDLITVDGTVEPPQVVPSHVMGGRHDCMWAGTCSSGQHQRLRFEPETTVAVTVTVKSSRSLLRTNRLRARSASPRPETPSESEEEESPLCKGVCGDNEDLSVVVSVSDVTGQIRTNNFSSPEIKTAVPTSPLPSFYTDHSYHINGKSAVTLDQLGVQTPSDSEEEIDVVSLGEREKLTSLPFNPSAKDRQQIQRTVATAIKHRSSRGRKRTSANVLIKSASEEKRPRKRRRGAEEEDDSIERRNQHNNMERLRRIDLRRAIVNLRTTVPAVSKNERAAKVLILKEAAKYCRQLEITAYRLRRTKEELFRRQCELAARVKELRLENAKMRGTVDEIVPLPIMEEKSPRKKRMGSRCGPPSSWRRQAAIQRMFAANGKKRRPTIGHRKKEKVTIENRKGLKLFIKRKR